MEAGVRRAAIMTGRRAGLAQRSPSSNKAGQHALCRRAEDVCSQVQLSVATGLLEDTALYGDCAVGAGCSNGDDGSVQDAALRISRALALRTCARTVPTTCGN